MAHRGKLFSQISFLKNAENFKTEEWGRRMKVSNREKKNNMDWSEYASYIS